MDSHVHFVLAQHYTLCEIQKLYIMFCTSTVHIVTVHNCPPVAMPVLALAALAALEALTAMALVKIRDQGT